MEEKEIKKLMNAETWMQGAEAVTMNFASGLLGAENIDKEENLEYANNSLRRVDIELAKAGMPRSERRALIKDLTSTPCAADDTTPCAGNKDELAAALAGLLEKFQQKK
jgi:hypothetical protein